MSGETKDTEQLSKKVKLFEAIVNQAQDGIVVFNHQFEVTFANTAAGKMLRLSPGEMRGKELFHFLPEEMRSHHEKLVSLFSISSETRQDLEDWRAQNCRRFDGTFFPAKITVEKFNISDTMAYIVTLTDMSEVDKIEKAKNHAEFSHFQIEQQSKCTASALQHSLELAITKIAKSAQLLKDGLDLQLVQENTSIILHNAFTALSMSQKAAFFTDTGDSSEALPLVDKSIFGSYERIKSIVDLDARNKNITMQWKVPISNRGFKLKTCQQVEQIMFNIVEDAIENAMGGDIIFDLSDISHGQDGKLDVHFRCHSTHFGIPQQFIDQVLSATSNADISDITNLANDGKRLRLAKHLTEKLGGTMLVASHPKEGTEIQVFLSQPVMAG